MCPLPTVLPTAPVVKKQQQQQPPTASLTTTTTKPLSASSQPSSIHHSQNNNSGTFSQPRTSVIKAHQNLASNHANNSDANSSSSSTATISTQNVKPTSRAGKVSGMVSMFERLSDNSSSSAFNSSHPSNMVAYKKPTTTSEKLALNAALVEEEKKKRFRARSNSFDYNSPSPNSSVTGGSTSSFGDHSSQQQQFTEISNHPTTLSENRTNSTKNDPALKTPPDETSEEVKRRLIRTPSMVQGLKARFEKLQINLLEQLKQEEEWNQKKKQRQLTARSHRLTGDEIHTLQNVRSNPSILRNVSNRMDEKSSSHKDTHHDTMNHNDHLDSSFDHDSVSSFSEDDSYEYTDSSHQTTIDSTLSDSQHHSALNSSTVSHNIDPALMQAILEEEERKQQVIETLMISPPPQIVKGLLSTTASATRQAQFYHELYGETASSSTPSPMGDLLDHNTTHNVDFRSSYDRSMNNDDWLENQMNRHQRYNISDLDLLTAYRHKSQLYQIQNPSNVMMNPFIQESQVVLSGHNDEDNDEYIYGDDGEYDMSDEYNDDTMNECHTTTSFMPDDKRLSVTDDLPMRRSSADMIGGVMEKQNEEEFSRWESQMEEFAKTLIC
ncbi:hypothetical protein FDP41_013516 [Naegleria fowleri]|uniref:Uncharacterized protein n=1 Tax=Naegleria fowleri TaxID=5763 RepID=A0A6A5C0H8_NAEFO|nr:uncharacterized protein FDP41_013516 [Naegleria fowleri]KAF0980302.1 hypothetical protein FDP41_013516 [Naegleria fowleri]CAG4713167.1 unnamed protein product [Naegleria fowleri]